MKKGILYIVLCFVLCLFANVASAHSGKTDFNGGHYDQTFNEYHYHHGYPAHQHYDMDGDGVIDCLYGFNDNTNLNSNSSFGSNDTTNNNSITSESNTANAKDKITFGKVVGVILLIIPLSLMTLYVLYISLGLIGIMIELVAKKCFKINIAESIQHRIHRILLIIGVVIIVPFEILFILGIL